MPDDQARNGARYPELFIGLTGALGTDMDGVARMLADKLRTVGYSTRIIVLSDLLTQIKGLVGDYDQGDECARIAALMDAGDRFRQSINAGHALAQLAISYVIKSRDSMRAEDAYGGMAYIFKSIKHVDEITRLRHVYGKNFWHISVYSPYGDRFEHLTSKTIVGGDAAGHLVRNLMARDAHDDTNMFGQNVRDAFAEADMFLRLGQDLQISADRLVEILFGNTFHTPGIEEVGMAHAFAASMASSSLSRQVGASILTGGGDLVSTGVNEVPKAYGGHYVAGDVNDAREWMLGYDSNTRKKTEGLRDLLSGLDAAGWLADHVRGSDMVQRAIEMERITSSAFLRPIEYGREVHAELSALMSALRMGVPVTNCTLYCTTFPCHMCAKHIITSGISRVVYIEPYPKSLAKDLYSDSITVDERPADDKVVFEPFTGVSPRRYTELFSMQQRKDRYGNVLEWTPILRYKEPFQYHKKELTESDNLERTMSDCNLEYKND